MVDRTIRDSFREGELSEMVSNVLSERFLKAVEDAFVTDVGASLPAARANDATHNDQLNRLARIKDIATIGYRFVLGKGPSEDDCAAVRQWRHILERAVVEGFDLEVVNSEDMNGPPDFIWLAIPHTATIDPPLHRVSVVHCICRPYCRDKKCKCDPRYETTGLWQGGKRTITECNSECLCEVNCGNRIVQIGKVPPLCIFKTSNRGWGVRTRSLVLRGTFLGLYSGHVYRKKDIPNNLSETDPKRNAYMFETEKNGAVKFMIDGHKAGSFTRFFNHSCSPNMDVVRVLQSGYEQGYCQIAFFAAEDIAEDEELTFSYGGDSKECLCRSEGCRGFY